jgi:hypothetical protein
MDIKKLLNGPRLPYESAVYTVFDLQYSEVHVISRDVNSKYGIVKNQLQDPDGMTSSDQRFLNNLTTHSQWRGGEDYAEFFDGVPPLDIIRQITRSRVMTGLMSLHHIVPYDRHDVNDVYRSELLPEATEVEEKYGGITYNNGDCLNVCIPQNMPPRFLMAKISICGYIDEIELPNGSVLYEKEVSRSLSSEWREVIRTNALSIIKTAVGRSYGVDEAISSFLLSPRVETWPRVMHQHLTVE